MGVTITAMAWSVRTIYIITRKDRWFESPPELLADAITNCVICERRLQPDRQHKDTCGGTCSRTQLRLQREANAQNP